jgi:hypothetical protein
VNLRHKELETAVQLIPNAVFAGWLLLIALPVSVSWCLSRDTNTLSITYFNSTPLAVITPPSRFVMDSAHIRQSYNSFDSQLGYTAMLTR